VTEREILNEKAGFFRLSRNSQFMKKTGQTSIKAGEILLLLAVILS